MTFASEVKLVEAAEKKEGLLTGQFDLEGLPRIVSIHKVTMCSILRFGYAPPRSISKERVLVAECNVSQHASGLRKGDELEEKECSENLRKNE